MPRNEQVRGTNLFAGFTHKQMIIVKFLISLMGYDENDSTEMETVRQMVQVVPVGEY